MGVVAFFRSSTSGKDTSGGTDIVVSAPAGVTDDDVLLVGIAYDGTTAPSTVPSGWTEMSRVNMDNGQLRQLGVWRKVAASEGASWTWAWSGGGQTGMWASLCYQGGQVITKTTQSGTNTNPTVSFAASVNAGPKGVAVSFVYCRWFSAGGAALTGVTWPAGMNERETQLYGDTRLIFGAGDEQPGTAFPARAVAIDGSSGALGVAGVRTSTFMEAVAAGGGSDSWGG